MKSIALICNTGLGDAILFERLANALTLKGFRVTVYSQFLLILKKWYPRSYLAPYPENIEQLNSPFWRLHSDYIFQEYAPGSHSVAHTDQKVLILGENFRLSNHSWHNHQIDFIKKHYGFVFKSLSSSICPPSLLSWRSYPKRVMIHPTSLKLEKNWPSFKFIQLAKRLHESGWDPQFCVTKEEKEEWDLQLSQAYLQPAHSLTLDDLAAYIYESAFYIGNDSGISHLASALKIPSLKIFDRKSRATFWSGGWPFEQVILPLSLPTRYLRVKFWKKMLSIKRVHKAFTDMAAYHS
jgi:heptosyltransferase-3